MSKMFSSKLLTGARNSLPICTPRKLNNYLYVISDNYFSFPSAWLMFILRKATQYCILISGFLLVWKGMIIWYKLQGMLLVNLVRCLVQDSLPHQNPCFTFMNIPVVCVLNISATFSPVLLPPITRFVTESKEDSVILSNITWFHSLSYHHVVVPCVFSINIFKGIVLKSLTSWYLERTDLILLLN